MPSTHIALAFLAATAVFAYVPGPALLYVASRTLAHGRGPGLRAAFGVHVGCYVHVVAAAAGLSVLFHLVPVLYMVVKLAGAAYVIWLGIRLILNKAERETAAPAIADKSGRHAFLESAMVEVLNPKTALFFVAFLPQFVDASWAMPVWAQFAVLGTVVNLMFSSADLICVLLAGVLVARLRRSGAAQRWLRRLGGGLLVGLGVHLALQRH